MDVLNHQPRRAGDGERRNGRSRRPASSVDGMASGSAAGERGVTRCAISVRCKSSATGQLPWRVGAAGCRQHWCHGVRRVNFLVFCGGRANDKSRPRAFACQTDRKPPPSIACCICTQHHGCSADRSAGCSAGCSARHPRRVSRSAELNSAQCSSPRLASPRLPSPPAVARHGQPAVARLRISASTSQRRRRLDNPAEKHFCPSCPLVARCPLLVVTFTFLPQARPRPAFANRLQPSQPDTQPSRPSASTASTSRSR